MQVGLIPETGRLERSRPVVRQWPGSSTRSILTANFLRTNASAERLTPVALTSAVLPSGAHEYAVATERLVKQDCAVDRRQALAWAAMQGCRGCAVNATTTPPRVLAVDRSAA